MSTRVEVALETDDDVVGVVPRMAVSFSMRWRQLETLRNDVDVDYEVIRAFALHVVEFEVMVVSTRRHLQRLLDERQC